MKPHEAPHINSNFSTAYNHVPSPLANSYQHTNMHTRKDKKYEMFNFILS